jgi:hypothetical protein
MSEKKCHNCKNFLREYHENYRHSPNRHGFECKVHGIQITRIGSDKATEYICDKYEEENQSVTNLSEIGF